MSDKLNKQYNFPNKWFIKLNEFVRKILRLLVSLQYRHGINRQPSSALLSKNSKFGEKVFHLGKHSNFSHADRIRTKTWYVVIDRVLKLTIGMIFFQPVLHALSFVIEGYSLYFISVLLLGVIGIIFVIFDCLVIYNFSKFFLFKNSPTENSTRYKLIAKHGIISSASLLVAAISYVMSIVLYQFSSGSDHSPLFLNSQILLLLGQALLQFPLWAFVFLKKALKECKDDVIAAPLPLTSTSKGSKI